MKIGVILIIEGNGERGIPRYAAVRALAQQAEEAGFDSLWLYDHFLFRGEGAPVGQWESFTFLTALAEAMRQVELGTLIACTAFRNPAMLASIATTLDEVSDGRFTLGLGAGWNETEFRALGIPYDHRVDRFEEALQIIVPLVRQGQVTFRGRYHQALECELVLRGPRPSGPPILIGASGPRMLRLAARYADVVNTGYPPHDHTRERAALDVACAAVGRDPATLPVTVPVWIAFPDLGRTPDHMRENTYPSAEAVANLFQTYDEAGVAHIMCDLQPNTSKSLTRLSEASALYRTR
ncbi:MAG: LLM class flavin-dependent oxidoreductase [Chloroflexota bacterium]|nr:LLM class flavin-dependent oxidoreductase [Chloroflexota bacterium]